MTATITASTAGMTSSFVMIEFDENDRALESDSRRGSPLLQPSEGEAVSFIEAPSRYSDRREAIDVRPV